MSHVAGWVTPLTPDNDRHAANLQLRQQVILLFPQAGDLLQDIGPLPWSEFRKRKEPSVLITLCPRLVCAE
jgi:hypothetical protein